MSTSSQGSGDPLYDGLAKHLTAPRLAPYVSAMHGDARKAIQLYQWNVALSGAVYEALHVFEVALRNAIDVEVSLWNATQLNPVTKQFRSPDWLLDPANLLVRICGEDDLLEARRRADKALRPKQRATLHADVLAQMSFGTWRFLLPDSDDGRQLLWREAVRHAFPNLSRPPEELTADVAGIYDLRNRVAHLETVLNSTNVRNQFNAMRRVLAEISGEVETWFVSNQRVTSVLKARPLP